MASKAAQNTRKGFPSLVTIQSSHSNHHGQDHEDSDQIDEENDYDTPKIRKYRKINRLFTSFLVQRNLFPI